MAINVNDDSFKKEVLQSELPVLVDFWAGWCMPCKMIAPVISEIEAEYKDKLKVCKVDVDEAPLTASEYNIMSIPTLIFFKNGNVSDSIAGLVPKEKIIEMIGV